MISALLLISSLLLPQATAQSDSLLEAQTREVGAKLRCPTCQGLSISDSPAAQDMRDLIRDQLRAGRTPEQVEAYFVEKFGDWILLKPPASGFNLALYIMPVMIVIAGIFLIVFVARKWSRASPVDLKPE